MNTQHSKIFELVTLGECQVNFYGEQWGASIKDMVSFKKAVGGLSTAIATGVQRLGLKTGIITKIGKDELGSFVLETLKAEGIEISQVTVCGTYPTALSFNSLHHQKITSHAPLRTQTADYALDETEVNSDYVASSQALLISSHHLFHPQTERAARKAVVAAHENQTAIILVLDNLAGLEATSNVLTQLETILPFCQIVIGRKCDFIKLTQTNDIYDAIQIMHPLTHASFIVKEKGGSRYLTGTLPTSWQTAPLINSNEEVPFYAAFSLAAFVAGFTQSWLQEKSLEKACTNGEACLYLANLHPEEPFALPTMASLESNRSKQNQTASNAKAINFFQNKHIHYASTRARGQSELFLVNMGTHAQWLKQCNPYGVNAERILYAKHLVAEAIINLKLVQSGLMLDESTHPATIELFANNSSAIARSVNAAGEVPLQFTNDSDITQTLRHWPKHHIVKASVIYHPDDRFALRLEQEAALKLLHRACRATHHELLIDIAPPTNSLITASTFAHIMNCFYEKGIYPDWWQMQNPRDARSWESISNTIDEHDPFCRGVILFAPLANLEQLKLLFNSRIKQKYCKGFVIGRGVFQPVLEQWLTKRMADNMLIENIGALFTKVLDAWHGARQILQVTPNLEKV